MDESTMKSGLLMEAAFANQKVAETSLKKLKGVSADLVTAVREEVHRVLIEELHSLAHDSRRAADALHAVERAAALRTLTWTVGLTTLCSLIPLGLASWLLPSPADIVTLRAKRDALTSRIAALEVEGGRMDLRRCGDGARLCVRVDRKAPTYGEQSDYLIIRGY
jgi:hypothetical protein